MPASEATIGLGTTFSYLSTAPSTYTSLPEVVSISPPQLSRDTVDVTHLTSPGGTREFKPTTRTGGEVEVTCNFTDAGIAIANTLYTDDEINTFQITFPDGGTEVFDGYVTGKAVDEVSIDSVRRFSLTITVSGLSVFTAGA